MQAHFILFLRNSLDALRAGERQHWWPETLVYVQDGHRPFEMFARAQSTTFFESLKGIFGVQHKDDFEPLLKAINEQSLPLHAVAI